MKSYNLLQQVKNLYRSMQQENDEKRNVYAINNLAGKVNDEAIQVSKNIRGADRPPAIIIHGVMPRSGTVYVGELLRLHPDIYAYPNELWEIPFLELTGDFKNIQNRFFDRYRPNAKKMGELDLLPLFGAALIAYLYSFVPQGKTLLIKVPDVKYLSYFPVLFPHEKMLLLMRDGRDLVNSTIQTWPQKKFSNVCAEWQQSARQMFEFCNIKNSNQFSSPILKYEEILQSPDEFVSKACSWYGLDPARYPYDKIKDLAYRGSSTLQSKGKVNWDPIKTNAATKTVGHWEHWSPKQKTQFKKIAGETLLDLGYCSDLSW